MVIQRVAGAGVAESPHFDAAKLEYLEATVHHRAVLAVALTEEGAELLARVNSPRATMR
jgi:hypothetical protein